MSLASVNHQLNISLNDYRSKGSVQLQKASPGLSTLLNWHTEKSMYSLTCCVGGLLWACCSKLSTTFPPKECPAKNSNFLPPSLACKNSLKSSAESPTVLLSQSCRVPRERPWHLWSTNRNLQGLSLVQPFFNYRRKLEAVLCCSRLYKEHHSKQLAMGIMASFTHTQLPQGYEASLRTLQDI